jgi:DNA-binding response OmpR family regulator
MKNILALDDDPAILACIRMAVKSQGYHCTTTSSFQEFFDLLQRQPVDLVMLDVCMPQKDGFEVLRTLRVDLKIPVLFVTGYAGVFTFESHALQELWEKEFSEGNTDILYKPFSMDNLFAKIEGLIGPAKDPP